MPASSIAHPIGQVPDVEFARRVNLRPPIQIATNAEEQDQGNPTAEARQNVERRPSKGLFFWICWSSLV